VQRGITHARQHQHPRPGAGDECRYRVDAALLPEIDVEDDHVGGRSVREVDRLRAARRRSDHFHAGLFAIDQLCEPPEDRAVIVNQHDPYRIFG